MTASKSSLRQFHEVERQGAIVPRAPSGIDPRHALEVLRRDGVLIIENALSAAQLTVVRDELDPWFDAAYHGAGECFGRRTRRFAGVLAKAPSAAALAEYPLVLSLFEAVLRGPNPEAPICDCIDLNLAQVIGIEPDEPPQFCHRDVARLVGCSTWRNERSGSLRPAPIRAC